MLKRDIGYADVSYTTSKLLFLGKIAQTQQGISGMSWNHHHYKPKILWLVSLVTKSRSFSGKDWKDSTSISDLQLGEWKKSRTGFSLAEVVSQNCATSEQNIQMQ